MTLDLKTLLPDITSEDERYLRTVTLNPWIPIEPHDKQEEFLRCTETEVLYGGSAGPGKSIGLLIAALGYVDYPQYNALLLRKSYKDLALPEAIMDVSHKWLDDCYVDGKRPHWNDIEKQWLFPSGATLTFGYMSAERDKDQYQGSAYHFIGVDELTQFTDDQYLWLMSRLRKKEDDPIPLRMWSASNPGNKGHVWVKQRFLIEGEEYGRRFIRATLADNPYLDREEYKRTLSNLDPITRRQLLLGDWDAVAGGGYFQREWFPIIREAPSDAIKVRSWDLAATPPTPTNSDPDWTVGAKVGIKDGVYYIFDIRRTRDTPQRVEQLIRQTAALDGQGTPIVIEQEPGSAGVQTIDYFRRVALPAFIFRGIKPTGPKETRIAIVSTHAEAGNVKLVEGSWIAAFLDECELYPEGHDDIVDAVAQGILFLQQKGPRSRVTWI